MRDMVEQSANEISWMDNTGCTVDKRERAEGGAIRSALTSLKATRRSSSRKS